MPRLICQYVVLGWLVVRFCAMVYTDFNGRKALEPSGFEGFVTSLIVLVVMSVLLYLAGAFSQIF